MSETVWRGISRGARLAASLPIVLVGIALMKLMSLLESVHRIRVWLVRKGFSGYHVPDSEAIRDCPDCDYRGVLAIDKHRAAPMSDINWELCCPSCQTTVEGPLHADDVSEYVNYCRPSDSMGSMMAVGGFAAFKTVQSHNERYALPVERVEELRRAGNDE